MAGTRITGGLRECNGVDCMSSNRRCGLSGSHSGCYLATHCCAVRLVGWSARCLLRSSMESFPITMQVSDSNPLAFETERFRGRLVGHDDLCLCIDLYTSPIVMLHLGGAMPRPQAEEWFEKLVEWNAEKVIRARYWAVSDARTKQPVGCLSLVIHKRPSLHGEVGIMLLPQAWRDGYSRQIMSGLIAGIFSPEWRLGISCLTAVCAVANRPACLLVEKLGFGCDAEVEGGLRRWRMCRSAWLRPSIPHEIIP